MLDVFYAVVGFAALYALFACFSNGTNDEDIEGRWQ